MVYWVFGLLLSTIHSHNPIQELELAEAKLKTLQATNAVLALEKEKEKVMLLGLNGLVLLTTMHQ